MDQPKVYKTSEAQRRAQSKYRSNPNNLKKSREQRKEHERQKYHNDPIYREKQLEFSRLNYQKLKDRKNGEITEMQNNLMKIISRL